MARTFTEILKALQDDHTSVTPEEIAIVEDVCARMKHLTEEIRKVATLLKSTKDFRAIKSLKTTMETLQKELNELQQQTGEQQ